MPDPGYFKSSLAFDFGAKSGRVVRGHLRSAIFPTAFMCNARRRTDTDFSVTDRHQSVPMKGSFENDFIDSLKCIAVPQCWRNHAERHAI